MKRANVNTLHRYIGITLAPFLVIQALSGLLLDSGLFREGAAGVARGEAPHGAWEETLVRVHFGPAPVHHIYLLLLVLGILWMAGSGTVLYLRGRRARRSVALKNAKQLKEQ